MAEIQVDADDLLASLDRGFADLEKLRANEARIVLPEGLRPNHRLAEALRERFALVPSLRRVVLVHASPAVRFLASSLGLLVPEIQFDVVMASRPDGAEADRSTGPTAWPAPSSVIEARLEDPIRLPDHVRDAFRRGAQTGATALLFVLAPDRPVERRLATILAEEMQSMLGLRLLVLVHPSPAVGFLASTLALQCPRAKVVGCASEGEAARILRARS